ncbi:MAG TPA: TetR family transcriptional regulator C-terminal domain-containing protein, partial [Solirubrobacteraceae bacterium]|nr:TetR family transcriptional regulator C-terminal domain-containing protein [Solirubrobacteraceae bacterium]
ELFLAMLDERFAKRIEDIESVIASEGSTAEKTRRYGELYAQTLRADREWERLFFEFSAYAVRDEDFREELVTRYRAMRERTAAALRAEAEEYGKAPTLPFEQVALMTSAMSHGFALEKLLEGDAVPDELFGTMLMVFFAGLDALNEAASEPAAGVSA